MRVKRKRPCIAARRFKVFIGAIVCTALGAGLTGCSDGSGGDPSAVLRAGPLMFIGTQLQIYRAAGAFPPYPFLDADGDGFMDTWGTYFDTERGVNRLAVARGSREEIFEPYMDLGDGDTPFAGDFDGDGLIDFAVTFTEVARGITVVRRLGIYWQLEQGTFSAVDLLAPEDAEPQWNWDVAGDFNGDGIADILLGGFDGAYATLLGDGERGFVRVRPPEPRVFQYDYDGVVVDVNGDGFDDLVESRRFYSSLGDGSFSEGIDIDVVVPGFVFYGLLDFTSDGIPDAFSVSGPGRVAVRQGNGDGTFGDAIVSQAPELDSSLIASGPDPVDIDGDGILDLISRPQFINLPVSPFSVWFGRGDGTFGRVTEAFDAPEGARYRGAFDADRDGHVDVLTYGAEGDYYKSVRFGNGDGTFRDGTTTFESRALITFDPGPAAAPDLDGDGIADFLTRVSVSPGGVSAYFGQAGAGFDSRDLPIQFSYDPGVDIDDDGDLDFWTMSPGESLLRIYRTYSRDEILPVPSIGLPAGTSPSIRFDDIDADGARDILLQGSYGLAAMYGLGGMRFEPAQPLGPTFDFDRFEFRDITGDGRLDMVGTLNSFEGGIVCRPAIGVRQFGADVLTRATSTGMEMATW